MGAEMFQKVVRLGLKNERSRREDRGAKGAEGVGSGEAVSSMARVNEGSRSLTCTRVHPQRNVSKSCYGTSDQWDKPSCL